VSERILFVDDEKFVLETFRRTLHRHFTIETAEGPVAALKQLEANGPFAVIVSDLKMPNMSGVELLSAVKSRYPDTIRIMLTGQGDLDAAMAAVNQGAIFRFLTKPCSPDALLSALNAAWVSTVWSRPRGSCCKTLCGAASRSCRSFWPWSAPRLLAGESRARPWSRTSCRF